MMEPAFAWLGINARTINKQIQRISGWLTFESEEEDGHGETNKSPTQAGEAEKRGCIEFFSCESRVDCRPSGQNGWVVLLGFGVKLTSVQMLRFCNQGLTLRKCVNSSTDIRKAKSKNL